MPSETTMAAVKARASRAEKAAEALKAKVAFLEAGMAARDDSRAEAQQMIEAMQGRIDSLIWALFLAHANAVERERVLREARRTGDKLAVAG